VVVDPGRNSSDPSGENDGPFAKLSAKLKSLTPTMIPSSVRETGVGTTVPSGIVNRPEPAGASLIAAVVVVVGAVVVDVVDVGVVVDVVDVGVVVDVVDVGVVVDVVEVGVVVDVVEVGVVVDVVEVGVVVDVVVDVDVDVEDVDVVDDVVDVEEVVDVVDVDDVVVTTGAEVVTGLFALSSESSVSTPLPSALRPTS